MKNQSLKAKITYIIFAALAFLIALLLLLTSLTGEARIRQSRYDRSLITIQNVDCQSVPDPDSPTGYSWEHRFVLDMDIPHDTSLAFYTCHHYVDVFIGEEYAYNIAPTRENPMIDTVGSSWVIIPLYREDAGKEVCVRLQPVYTNFHHYPLEFSIGSEHMIFAQQLRRDLPQLIVCGCSIILGVLLMAIAIYMMLIKKESSSIFFLSISAICLALWRLLDTFFSPFFARERPILLFTLSLAMLMLCLIPLAQSLKRRYAKTTGPLFDLYSLLLGGVFLIQLLLQLFGICDLRATLTVTHVLIGIGAALILGSYLHEVIILKKTQPKKRTFSFTLVILLGALIDLAIFYIYHDSSKLVYTLIAFVCYVLYAGLKFFIGYNRQQTLLAEKEVQITQSRITLMLSQIRSHFIFNVLNAISGMCKYDPAKADKTIVYFARYLRTNIDIMQDDQLVTFHATLRHVEDYIALEQIRFSGKIQFETDITEEHFLLPPLLLQPLVENAIVHGLTPKPDGGTIRLQTEGDDRFIRIRITDDGVGFDTDVTPPDKSVGMKNVRFRLEQMVHGQMIIESSPGVGTTVTLQIPRKEATL